MVARRQSKKINRNSANRARQNPSRGVTRNFAQRGPANQRVFKLPRSRIAGMNTMNGISKLSEAGLAFLKCAFASPDFSVDPGKGIPDQFHGRTLSIKDCFTTAITFAQNKDTFILQAPVPGYAYFKAEVDIGAGPTQFVGVPFPTFETNFGRDGTDVNNNFSKFRYASMASGIYPTSNMMQFAGSIQAWRVDLNLAESLKATLPNPVGITDAADISNVVKRIQGLSGVQSLAPRDNYSNSFIQGAYTFAFDKSQDFTWTDFCAGHEYISTVASPQNAPATISGKYLTWDGTHYLPGLGNVNTIVYKISTPPDAVNTAIVRFWNCVELQPDTNSSLFQFSGVSPSHDPLALEIYHNIKMKFPVAMPCSENSKFWRTVLQTIVEATKLGSYLPGPVGLISGGAHTIASTISGLF